MSLILSLDLGQTEDYSAFVVVEQTLVAEVRHYGVRHLERFPLNTPYPQIVARVAELVSDLSLNITRLSTRPESGALSTIYCEKSGTMRGCGDHGRADEQPQRRRTTSQKPISPAYC